MCNAIRKGVNGLTSFCLQTLLLGGPEEQASEADATHASKRPRLDPDAADLGNEDEDEVRFPVLCP